MAFESSVIVGSGISVLREPEVQNVPRMRGSNSVVVNYEDVNSLLGIAQSSGLAVGTDSIQLTGPENRLRKRRKVLIQNLGDLPVYLGASGVTTSDGYRIDPLTSTSGMSSLELDVLDYGDLWVVADGDTNVRILELR